MLQQTGGAKAIAESPNNVDEFKKQRLVNALLEAGGNRSEAARLLGISRTSVWNQMKRYNIRPAEQAIR